MQLLTPEQLAERWQVTKFQIYALSRNRQIPCVHIGRYYRYHPEMIERFEMEQLGFSMKEEQSCQQS
jgi:hypothetical protein